jgi:hypothetical protein
MRLQLAMVPRLRSVVERLSERLSERLRSKVTDEKKTLATVEGSKRRSNFGLSSLAVREKARTVATLLDRLVIVMRGDSCG